MLAIPASYICRVTARGHGARSQHRWWYGIAPLPDTDCATRTRMRTADHVTGRGSVTATCQGPVTVMCHGRIAVTCRWTMLPNQGRTGPIRVGPCRPRILPAIVHGHAPYSARSSCTPRRTSDTMRDGIRTDVGSPMSTEREEKKEGRGERERETGGREREGGDTEREGRAP